MKSKNPTGLNDNTNLMNTLTLMYLPLHIATKVRIAIPKYPMIHGIRMTGEWNMIMSKESTKKMLHQDSPRPGTPFTFVTDTCALAQETNDREPTKLKPAIEAKLDRYRVPLAISFNHISFPRLFRIPFSWSTRQETTRPLTPVLERGWVSHKHTLAVRFQARQHTKHENNKPRSGHERTRTKTRRGISMFNPPECLLDMPTDRRSNGAISTGGPRRGYEKGA